MTVARAHAEWLSLIETSGPFLTLPVLQRALPHGLEPTDSAVVDDLRHALQEFEDDSSLQPRWMRWVMASLLGFPDEVLREGAALSPLLTHRVTEGETLRPDLAVVDTSTEVERARLLVKLWPVGMELFERPVGSRWAATPVDRMAELCRASGVRLGLVTNGDAWVLVDAVEGSATATAMWDAALWLEERLTLDAFTTLVGVRRFFSVATSDTLEALLGESASAEAEVTDQLGRQVRAAVELLVDAMSRANRERQGTVFGELTPAQVYEAAVTVMMRLVFLLSAEERDLFLLGDETYDTTYAVSTLLGQLEEEANRYGEDVLERRTDAWHRLLATFRMVHAGASHENLRLAAYGGSLFDPDRFAFLEGRRQGEVWTATASSPLPLDNRTIKHVLDALQVLRFSGRGGVSEARRLSFRSIDVEQVGHVYEGLLDHSAVRVDYPAMGLEGKNEPELALAEVEERAASARPAFAAWLVERTGRTARQIERAIDAEADHDDLDRLISACDNDHELAERVAPFLGLLRRDLRGLPVVYLPDSFYVTKSGDRRSSGTYYTPRALAEEMVAHTLEPLVYSPGPAEGAERWKLRPSAELLDLRVCDMAMGSGAFLVAACRYLSGCLLEAWAGEGLGPGDPVSLAGGTTTPIPEEETDRQLLARRLMADRCLFGVDRNPMAVEMAKLSLWLVTLAKDRPFTFVDHALRCGDSLLGITDLRQLDALHLDPSAGRALHGGSLFDPGTRIEPVVKAALDKRRQLESFPVIDIGDAERKQRLLDEAGALLDQLKVIGDLVVGAALSTATQRADAYDTRLLSIADEVAAALDTDRSDDDRQVRLFDLRLKAEYWLDEGRPLMTPDRKCLHWPLEFPEVFLDRPSPGFDAVVGNPPFLGGKRISGAMGSAFREHLVRHIAGNVKGNADLVAFFFLRAGEIGSRFGLLATNTIAQGDTREVGLDVMLESGWTITEAVKSTAWPGDATLEIAKVWLQNTSWVAPAVLDGVQTARIDALLEPGSGNFGQPQRLAASKKQSFIGSALNTDQFIIDRGEAEILLRTDARNVDVIVPFLNGENLNSNPEQLAARFVINMLNWSKEHASEYTECLQLLERRVLPEVERKTASYAGWINRWWQFWRVREELYGAIQAKDRVLALTCVSKVVQPAFVPSRQVFSHALTVFNYDDDAHFGLLSSGFHWWWAVTRASTMRTDVRYTPTDCFETFPQPQLPAEVGRLGRELDEHRRDVMLERWEGLTKTYNRVHSRDEDAEDIEGLRRLHTELDCAVAEAYGWSDVDLDHGFHETRQGIRHTLGPLARNDVLDRLLELNHERYGEEVSQGLHGAVKRGRSTTTTRRGRKPKAVSPSLDLGDA